LGPGRRTRGVQQERDIVGGRRRRWQCLARLSGEREEARRVVHVRHKIQNRHALGARDGSSRRVIVCKHDERLRIEIGQIKVEVISAIGRVQRSAGCARRDGQKRGGHLRPVRQDHRDSVAVADAEGTQRRADVLQMCVQAGIRQRATILSEDGDSIGRLGRPRREHLPERDLLAIDIDEVEIHGCHEPSN
jgi:hypothetical protein